MAEEKTVDPRDRPDGTRDNGAVLDHNVGRRGWVADKGKELTLGPELPRFEGKRAMGEDSA